MTWAAGPAFTPDENGRVVVDGFEITKSLVGYRATALKPLTDVERTYGCKDNLDNDNVLDLILLIKGQRLLRAGIRRAAASAHAEIEQQLQDTNDSGLKAN